MTFEEKVKLIKDRVNIFNLCNRLYPGHKLGIRCRSPFRQDSNPSFSVNKEGTLFNDFAGDGGDIFKFYQLATGSSFSDALKYLSEIAGIDDNGSIRPIIRPVIQKKEEEKAILDPPVLEIPTEDELKTISNLRCISAEGLQVAVDRCFLWTSTIREQRVFVLTDSTRKFIQARRMDGLTWEKGKYSGWSPKAFTLPGSDATTPLGIFDVDKFQAIAICEGGPDFLTAFDFAHMAGVDDGVAPVMFSSASIKKIPDKAWVKFSNKRIRIFAHADNPGQESGKRWMNQLKRIASSIDIFNFDGLIRWDGNPVEDLNDMANCRIDSFKTHMDKILNCMEF